MTEDDSAKHDGERRANILAVDDMPSILHLLQITLSLDYEVTSANSGFEALAAIEKKPFDLILLDFMMPGIDGLETLRQLRQQPNFGNTPVIFLTALDDLASERSALELGADDYIVKPFKPSLIQLRIANLLHRSELQQELELALASADQGLWEWNLRTNRVKLDARKSKTLGLAHDTPDASSLTWDELSHPECRKAIEASSLAYLSGKSPAFDVDARLLKSDGSWAWVNIYGKASVTDPDGKVLRLKGTYRNIDRHKLAENALRESEERLRFVMAATGEGIWDWLIHDDIVSHNASWYRLLGQEEKVIEHPVDAWRALIHPEDSERVEKALTDCLSGKSDYVIEHRLRHADGHYIWILDRGKVVERASDGSAIRIVGAIKDITERKMAEAEFKRLALFDPLTGLPNRRLLVDRLQQAISKNRRHGQGGALMFIDLDRFKQLNDTLGHDFGDMLLIEVGKRLGACMRETDTAARLGGDEFVVMLTELPEDRASALVIAEKIGAKILESLNETYQLGPHPYCSTPSIGLTLFSNEQGGVDQILKRADSAMYEAKKAGRNCLKVGS